MPCATIHLWLAQKALSDWEQRPAEAPFPLTQVGVDAFLHGSLAPDWGFVPGGHRFHSVLAHYVDPAILADAMLTRAESDLQRGFAWGWVAHVLADAALHPEVGRAAGETLKGDRSVRLNAMDDIETHVGLEVGWDILTLRQNEGIPAPRTSLLFDRESIGFVQAGYRDAYGVHMSGDTFLRSHVLGTQRTARWPNALRFLDAAYGLTEGTRTRAKVMVGAARSLAPRRSAMRGFFTPIRPPAWLLDRARNYRTRFTSEILAISSGERSLENRNLESGETAGIGDAHPEAVAAYQRLSLLRRESPAKSARL